MKAALGDHQLLPGHRQVPEHFADILVDNGGAYGHAQHQVFTTLARAIATATGFTTLGAIIALKAVIHHGVEGVVGFHNDAAAITAIPPVGATSGNVFLTPETQGAVATLAGVNIDTCLIYKFHCALAGWEDSLLI